MKFSGAVLRCFTLSRSTISTEVSPIRPEDLPVPPFEAILHATSWVGKIVNSRPIFMDGNTPGRLSESMLSLLVREG